MADLLLISGILMAVAGILLKIGLKFPLLPGDIFIKNGNMTFYFPIITCIILSIVITLIMNRMK